MRVLLAIALIVSGLTGITAVRAADLPIGNSGNYPPAASNTPNAPKCC